LLFAAGLFANNLQISSVNLSNDSTITFNISWENSWRVSVVPQNHDASWIFIKKRDCASGQWSHVDLSSTLSDHTAATPLEVYLDGKDVSAEAKGLFLRRSTDGVGNIINVAVSVRIKNLGPADYDFKVYGIEMVQIPQDSFYLGDGNGGGTYRNGSSTAPYYVTSENAIAVANTVGKLYTASSTNFRPVSLPAAFPKGYAEIYSMKYEITQGQYVDFFNSLNADQAPIRYMNVTTNRHNISGVWPVVTNTLPHRAMGFLGWADYLAFLDWSALRPMTDLEFEKICRGPIYPVKSELAWGTTLYTRAATLISDGTPNESVTDMITPGSGIASIGGATGGVQGSLRSGFAAKTATSRLEAGATYYGVMEMTGNVYEQVISTTTTTGVAFTGMVGDGEISTTPSPGYANVPFWPSKTASTVATSGAVGKALRGGGWAGALSTGGISNRTYATYHFATRINTMGGRGVR